MKSLKPDADSAQVRIPPPLFLLVCLIGGISGQIYRPVHLLSEEIRFRLGGPTLILGVLIMFFCVRGFKKIGTNLPPWKPTTQIKTSGFYRFSRNPIYMAFILIGMGLGFCINSLWVVLSLLPFFLFINGYVIPKEEAYLKSKFGQAYLSYQAKVRRWL